MRDGMVSFQGRRFRVLLDTYRQRDLADFSPRASLPSQSINQSELLLYQPLVMTDWRHGFGFMWMTDAMGYMKSDGGIDTRFAGMIASAPKRITIHHRNPRNSDFTRPYYANGCIPVVSQSGNYLFLYGDGVYNIINDSLQGMTSGISGGIFDALSTTKYVFFGNVGRLRKFNLSNSTWSDAGVNSNSAYYHWLRAHNGYIFAGKFGTNQVYFGSNEDLSDLHGDPNDDPDVIYVGFSGFPTLKAVQFGQELLVAKPEGIFTIGQDMVARRVVDFSSDFSGNFNFNLFTVYNGMVYFNIKNKIYMWNGARMQDVSIPRFNDEFPFVEVSQVVAGSTAGGYLYVLANWKPEESSSYITSLFAHDGVGWHKLHDFTEFPQSSPYSWVQSYKTSYFIAPVPPNLSLTYNRNALVICIPVSTGIPLLSSYYRFVIENSQSPVPPFAPSGVWYSPRLDMGFRRVTKSAVQLQIEVQKAHPSTPIQVSVRFDDNPTWYNLGTINSTGIHHLDFSAVNSTTKTAEFRYMIIRLTFTGTDTQTAIVEGITVRFLMRPNVFYGWNMDIIASQEYTFDGQVFETSPEETLTYLKTLRDSKAPIEFIDLQGGTYHGYISAINVQSLELFEPATDSTTNIESVININFVEAR